MGVLMTWRPRFPDPKPCGRCSSPFVPTGSRQRYCSQACQRRAWWEKHKTAEQQRCRDWRARNRTPHRSLVRAWRERNRERVRAYARAWARQNRDLCNLYIAARRARVRAASSAADLRTAIAKMARVCAYCGRDDVPLTFDHRVPLSRGGSHDPDNLILACRSCNSRKHTQSEIEFRALLAMEAFIDGRRGGVGEDEAPYRVTLPCRRPRHRDVRFRDRRVARCDAPRPRQRV